MLKTHPRELIERGWYLLPVEPNDKNPYTRFARKGFYSASNELEQIEKWLEKKPNLNWGVACKMSGLVVIDCDYRNMNQESWSYAKEIYADTYQVETGDGMHFYFSIDQQLSMPAKLAEGIDVKYNGYVVGEGSTHPNGKTYTANPMPIMNLLDHPILKGELL
jgi:hypothetical protein